MKQLIKIILFISPLSLLLAYLPACQSTYVGRYIAWNNSDIKDHEKFPKRILKKAETPFFFTKSQHTLKTLSYDRRGNLQETTLEDFLEITNTTALIIVKNDSIYYEGYGSGYTRNSINTSFSIAKSITGLLVGIALDEGLIESINEPMIKYIPELKQGDPVGKVRIHELLMMQSGFYYIDHDLPWGDKPKNYYCPDLRGRAFQVRLDKEPGTSWEYMGYNPIICGMILERATGKTITAYFEEKIWQSIGTEFDGSWSTDSEESMMEKMESGINGRAIDFLKLARLFYNKGTWEGKQLVSQQWINDCSSLLKSVKAWEGTYYNNFWWIFPANDTLPEVYAALGHLGQYLLISPTENTIIVRFGKNKGGVDSWISLLRKLSASIDNTYNNSIIISDLKK